jgi:phosphopantetheinyl transferase
MPLILRFDKPVVGIWKIDESADFLRSLLPNIDLSPTLASTNERIISEKLAVRALLKELTNNEPVIKYQPDGAPFLPNSTLSISISHTKGYVAIALNEHSPAGIDIEHVSDRVLRVKSKFLSDEEQAFLDNEPFHSLICWCAKEALYKCIGKSGVIFTDHLRLSPFSCKDSGLINAVYAPEKRTFSLRYLINKYFVTAWLLDNSETSLPPVSNSTIANLPFLFM